MPPPIDPFRTLGLPLSMNLTRAAVDAAYFARVAILHPDSATGGDGDSEAAMATLNQARATLADPEKRAESLLTIQNPAMARTEIPLDPSFLMEFMEVREAVDEAIQSRDGEALTRWSDWVVAQRADLLASTSRAFASGDHRVVRSLLNQWRYVERLAEKLRDAVGGGWR